MENYFINLENKFKHLQRRARRKNIPFNLTYDWLTKKLHGGRCEVTGLPFKTDRDPFVNPYYPSIDRIDSNKGYTENNCQLVCHMYNTAKCEFPEKVFAYWAAKFVEKYEEEHNEIVL